MKKNLLIIFVLMIFSLSFVFVKADCIGATQNFTSGDYVTESCTFNESMTCNETYCLWVNADNIIIDGDGFTYDGEDVGTFGIYFNSFNSNNFTLSNITLKRFYQGMNWANNNNLHIKNVNVFNCTNSGLVFDYTTNITIEDSNIEGNAYYGIGEGYENQGIIEIHNVNFKNHSVAEISMSSGGHNFYNNTINSSSQLGIFLNARNIDSRQNIIHNNFGIGFTFTYCSEQNLNTKIYNNTINMSNFFNCLQGNNIEVMENDYNGAGIAYLGLVENISMHDNDYDLQAIVGNGILFDSYPKKNVTIEHEYFFNVTGEAITSSNAVCDINLPCIIDGNLFNVSTTDFIFLIGSNFTAMTRNFVIRNNLFIDHNINDDINDLSAFKVWYVDNIKVYNNTIIRGHDQGIWTWGMINSEIYDNNVTDCDCMPYQTERSNYNNYWHDNYARNTTQSIIGLWFDIHNNTYENFLGEDVKNCVQIFGRLTYNNTFSNITCYAKDSNDSGSFGLLFDYLVDDWGGAGYPNNNLVKNIHLYNFYDGIVTLDGGIDNVVQDSLVFNSTINDVHLYNSALTDPNISLTLLNVSFDKSKVTITKGTLFSKWYGLVTITDTTSNPISNVAVTFRDYLNQFNYYTTDSNGIVRTNTTEFMQNSTDRYNSTPYIITAVKEGYKSQAKTKIVINNFVESFALENGCRNSEASSNEILIMVFIIGLIFLIISLLTGESSILAIAGILIVLSLIITIIGGVAIPNLIGIC